MAFVDGGFAKAWVLKVMFAVTSETYHNSVNQLAETPLNAALGGAK